MSIRLGKGEVPSETVPNLYLVQIEGILMGET